MSKLKLSPIVLLLTATAGLAAEIAWEADLDGTLARARTQQRAVIVDFGARWCKYCIIMERTVLQEAAVQQALAPYLLVRVDTDQQPRWAARYQAHQLPTFIKLDAAGQVLSRAIGYHDAAAFIAWLHAPAAAPPDAVAPSVVDNAEVEDCGIALSSPDTRSQALATVVERCAARDTADREPWAALLRDFAVEHPTELIDYLDRPRLAERLAAGNALAAAFADFVYDPWLPQADRQAAIEAWRERLQSDE